MTLSEKMRRLAEVSQEIEALTATLLDEKRDLENEIEAEVLELGQSIAVDNVTAKYSKGRGGYDYAGAYEDVMSGVEEMEDVVTASQLKDKHTEIVRKFDEKAWCIDWLGKVSAENLFKQHYTAGSPSVSIVIK